MEGANSHTNWTLGCAESLSMQVSGIPFKLHAHVVERAPFRLLLGRPFTHQLLCRLEDLPNGKVEVSIRDPRNISHRVYIPSRPRRIHVASLRVSSYSINHTPLSITDLILESSATSDLDSPSEPPDLTTINSPIGPFQFANISQRCADAPTSLNNSESPIFSTIESPIGQLQFTHTPQGWADAIATAPPPAPDSFCDDDAALVSHDRDDFLNRELHGT